MATLSSGRTIILQQRALYYPLAEGICMLVPGANCIWDRVVSVGSPLISGWIPVELAFQLSSVQFVLPLPPVVVGVCNLFFIGFLVLNFNLASCKQDVCTRPERLLLPIPIPIPSRNALHFEKHTYVDSVRCANDGRFICVSAPRLTFSRCYCDLLSSWLLTELSFRRSYHFSFQLHSGKNAPQMKLLFAL